LASNLEQLVLDLSLVPPPEFGGVPLETLPCDWLLLNALGGLPEPLYRLRPDPLRRKAAPAAGGGRGLVLGRLLLLAASAVLGKTLGEELLECLVASADRLVLLKWFIVAR
jgi:hypothetical protein